MRFYQNYLDHVAVTPRQEHIDLLQASINAQWENNTQNYPNEEGEILQQRGIGSPDYYSEEISVDMAIDLTTGQKLSDDFKTFSHRNISVDTLQGLMYKFDDNYWITINTSDIASVVKSSIVRRCNNFAKWVDVETGRIISVPCIIDYTVSSPSPRVDKDVITPNGHIVLIIQGNADTLKLRKNQRFLFNGEPYKLVGYNNMLQNGVVDNTTSILYFNLFLDEIQPTDDVVNNLANAFEYDFQVSILGAPIAQLPDFTGVLSAQVELNGEVLNHPVQWSAINAVIDQSGGYRITGVTGDVATITAVFGSYQCSVDIGIVDQIDDNFKLVIEPVITELSQGDSVFFNVDLYNNGVKQPSVIDAVVSGASPSCYSFSQESPNRFLLTNRMRSLTPLAIRFSVPECESTIVVGLKAVF